MTVQLDDTALMMRFSEGDTTAFETLYRRHKGGLYRYCLRHCGDSEVAADLFQEIWGKLIGSRRRYRPTARFTTYLYRIAHNCFVDHLRRRSRQPVALAQHDAREIDALEYPDEVGLDEQLDRSLVKERLRRALIDLPAEQRDAFLLREEAGLSMEEIAKVMGVGFETAKSRLRYAVRKLKLALLAEERRLTGTE